jgi:hypothetical protein
MIAADASEESKYLNQKESKPLFAETVQQSPVPETTDQPYVAGDEAVSQ